MKRILILASALLLSALTLRAQPSATAENLDRKVQRTDAAMWADLDTYISKVKTDWNINGLVVMVGDDSKVLFSKGYGWRDDEAAEKIPMDENTLFQIASVSKSFTTALIASLVDEGRLKWDDRVVDILPDFKMYDPWVTEHLLVKDLSCHRTGLAGNEGASIARLGYTKEEMMHMMRLMKPVYPFRGGYRYNNHTFCVSALIVEKLTGKSWEENIRERIYKPLGMTGTFRGAEYAAAFADHSASQPYGWSPDGGRMSVNRLTEEDVCAGVWAASEAAGGIICTPSDMFKWAQFHLNEGKAGEKQIISKKQMTYLHTGINIVSQSPIHTTVYGHGWLIEQTEKCRMIWHTGTNSGQISICVFIPELNRVITINANTQIPNEPRFAIVRRAVDLMLGLEDYDYNADYLSKWHRKYDSTGPSVVAIPTPKPSAEEIAGTYTNGEWGDILVENGGDGLTITLLKPGFSFSLEHVDGNVFQFNSASTRFRIEFLFDTREKACGLKYINTGATILGSWQRK